MNENEKRLFKALCKFQCSSFNEELLKYASSSVLGELFFNRMQGIAYGTLKQHGLLYRVNREFRNSLSTAYEQNRMKNAHFLNCVNYVAQVISECACKIAMLKGAYLCAHYPDGYRTSNDIDLLVLPENVTMVGNALTAAGFKQGSIRNGVFVPATRQQIIESKMLRGETVPYIKTVNLPYMEYLEVDINFSLDYKNSDTDILSSMLSKICLNDEKGIQIPTLEKNDFFLHLCAHLHKEATTLPWIEMHRDMTLYKYSDIYLLLSEMTKDDIDSIFVRAGELGIEKICAFTVWETMELFDIANDYLYQSAKDVLAKDPTFLLRVVSPKDKKFLYYRTLDTNSRFFMENRMKDLQEGPEYEKIEYA